MSRTEIIAKLQTFLSDRESLAKLERLMINDEKQAQHFIREVSAALNQNSRRVWNDWGYFDPLGAAIMFSGFILVVGQKMMFPRFAYSGAILGGLYSLIGLVRHQYLQQLTWQGTESVEEMLYAITSTEKLSVWQHSRLQTEIIFRFIAAEMAPKKIEKLYNLRVDAKNNRNFNTKKIVDFVGAIDQLLPELMAQVRRNTSFCRYAINRGGVFLLALGVFTLYRFVNNDNDVYGFISAAAFIFFAMHARESALKMKYGGSLVGQWDIHRIKAILTILQTAYQVERNLEIKLPLLKPAPANLDKKGVNKSKNWVSKKSRSCHEKLVQGGALLFHWVKAVALFGFQIMSKPFRADPKVDKYTEEEINQKKPKKEKQSQPRVIVEEKGPSRKAKKPAARNNRESARKTTVEQSSSGEVEQLSIPQQNESVPIAQLHIPQQDEIVTIAQQPVRLIPKKSSSDVKSENQTATITMTSPEFFGGRTFEVRVPKADAPRWAAFELTDQERLAIYQESHPLICHNASRSYSEIQKLQRALITAQTPKKKTEKAAAPVTPTVSAMSLSL